MFLKIFIFACIIAILFKDVIANNDGTGFFSFFSGDSDGDSGGGDCGGD